MSALASLDGYLIAAVWLAAAAAFIAIVGAWDRKPRRPRAESHSELAHRIDAEAREACIPPVIWSGGNTLPNREAEYHGSEQWGR